MNLPIPTQDEIDSAMFLVRWGKYLFIGALTFAGIGVVAHRGKQECETVNMSDGKSISKDHVMNLIEIERLKTETQMRKEFKSDLKEFREALMGEIKRLGG